MSNPLQRAAGMLLRGATRLVRPPRGLGLGPLLTGLGRLAGDGTMMTVKLGRDSRFRFPMGDTYWTRPALFAGEPYEPEFAWLLHRAAALDFAVIDGGANLGYWSILASGAAHGGRAVLAIEAGAANVAMLTANAQLNAGRFTVLHRAVAERSGEIVTLYGSNHWGLSLEPDWHPNARAVTQQVTTIALDDAAAQLPPRRDPPLIKLDVEGAERAALKGAQKLLASGALIFYEEHGKDPSHAATRLLLDRGDMDIWGIAADRRLVRIRSAEQIAAIATDPVRGYNFFACTNSSPWAALFAAEVPVR